MNYNVYEWGGISLNSEKKYSDGNGSSDGIHDFTIGSPVDFEVKLTASEIASQIVSGPTYGGNQYTKLDFGLSGDDRFDVNTTRA